MELPPNSNRVSKRAIIDLLRRRIVTGHWPSGSRLPSRRELVRDLQASSVTVQRAMDKLMLDGFAYSDGPNGTFVSQYPPHLCRYGLLLQSQPKDRSEWRRFGSVLCDEATRLASAPQRTIKTYYEVNGHPDSEDYQKLLRDLRGERLAGLIILGSPLPLFGTAVMEAGAPPRVAFTEEAGQAGTPAVGHDSHSFIDKAVEHLYRRGRRRIAILLGEKPPGGFHNYLMSALAARGMTHKPYWTQGVFVGHPELARNSAWLLMNENQTERPDGLIICDDNLVEHAVGGLLEAGIQAPRDMDVVAHANFPWTTPVPMQMHRVGYHAGQTLETCLGLIDSQRRGEEVPRLTLMPALEEDDAASLFRRSSTDRAELASANA